MVLFEWRLLMPKHTPLDLNNERMINTTNVSFENISTISYFKISLNLSMSHYLNRGVTLPKRLCKYPKVHRDSLWFVNSTNTGSANAWHWHHYRFDRYVASRDRCWVPYYSTYLSMTCLSYQCAATLLTMQMTIISVIRINLLKSSAKY